MNLLLSVLHGAHQERTGVLRNFLVVQDVDDWSDDTIIMIINNRGINFGSFVGMCFLMGSV